METSMASAVMLEALTKKPKMTEEEGERERGRRETRFIFILHTTL